MNVVEASELRLLEFPDLGEFVYPSLR